MELFNRLDTDFKNMDERGGFVQLVHQGYVQINVINTVAGGQRGGHYHKSAKEAFYIISGSTKVELQSIDNKAVCKKIFSEGDFFYIPPFVMHTFSFTEDCVMLSMYDRHIIDEQGVKDIYYIEG